MFSVMLNLFDLTSLDIRNLDAILFAHIAFTFMVSILMINFFIALLSHSVSTVTKYERLTLRNHRSTVAISVSQKLSRIKSLFRERILKQYYLLQGDRVLLVYPHSVVRDHKF